MIINYIIEVLLKLSKWKLIFDLQTRGIKFLIKQMASDKNISHLVAIKQKRGGYSSEDSVSTYAFQQSNKLHSQKDRDELIKLLEDQNYINLRFYIYCCLACICSNTNDIELYDFLISKIENGFDEQTQVAVLVRLEDMEKSPTFNIEPIKKILLGGTSDLRRAAIRALSRSNDKEVEDLILNEFNLSDKDLKSTICITLKSVGTKKSIPILRAAQKQTRDFGLRWLIDDVIEIIEDRENSYH